VNQQGALADYLEVTAGYERAVEALLGDLLQHVIVERPEYAAAGFDLVREHQAGRCGFFIASAEGSGEASAAGAVPDGLIPFASVVRATGPYAPILQNALGQAAIADTYDQAATAAAMTMLPVATRQGDVFRGPHFVTGGNPQETRGILETKREILDLGARIASEREALNRLADETDALVATMSQASSAIAALTAEQHRQEKVMVGLDAQLSRANDDALRVEQKRDQLARERRQAEEERDQIDHRQDEARRSISSLDTEQGLADERLTAAQRRLFEAREHTDGLSRRAGEARAVHAALVERAAALTAEVQRLEEAAAELEARAESLRSELAETGQRIDMLGTAIAAGEQQLDADIRALENERRAVQGADDDVAGLRIKADEIEAAIRDARHALEAIRTEAAELDIARATAESDLAHLAATCESAVQETLNKVLADVEVMEAEGDMTPDAAVICADEGDEGSDEEGLVAEPLAPDALAVATQQTLSAEDAIARLKAKIDRLGPVNMMAIEQYDELETRHTFLTTQRKDLVDSIAQTSEAIKRIDETTRHRFVEAFAAINRNFQEMFTTLFGGGRAALTLLDENDPLESGIEIVAQPPGKRLQSVQLLSGGEKALTAISLMFGLFKFKPSPFCLLDEIDAPLDDANVGRFVEMLRSMQQHTQFILITHNRKTMEIADRLYGVTMEEPGVSKLISVQLN
jgi:chromosome segregation protein